MANLLANLAVALVGQLLYMVFAPKPPDVEGPRLESLNIPAISPGNPINRVWGTMTVPGQLIWTTGLKETVHVKKVKGGKGGKSQKVTTYTYSTSLAVAICEGPIYAVRRIKAQQKVIYESSGPSLEADLIAYTAERTAYWNAQYSEYPPVAPEGDGFFAKVPNIYYQATAGKRIEQDVAQWKKEHNYEESEYPEYGGIHVYTGTEDQMPDSIMESILGVGNVPAHRGVAYFVIEELQLADFGNSIPSFTIEVARNDGKVSVHTILIDLCQSAGLVKDDSFFVSSELKKYEVHGYALTALTAARAAIESLQQVHPFEGIESGESIQFRTRDRLPIGGIRYRDMRTDDKQDGAQFRLERTRIDDLQLPRRIELAYQDVNRDYSQNKVYIARTFTESIQVKSLSLTIASDPATMKRAVEIQMAEAYAARNSMRCRIPAKYLRFRPGDVVMVETESGQWRQVRIAGMTLGANYILEVDFQDYMGSETGLVALSDERVAAIPGREYISDTETFILDTPSLDDTTLESGVYVVFGASPGLWIGGALYRNVALDSVAYFGQEVISDVVEWELEFTNTSKAIWGVTTSLLEDGSAYGVDYSNALVVQFLSGGSFFTEISLDDASKSPINVFMVGNEVIQALKPTLIAGELWVFTGLIRGLRGTDWAMNSHALDERVIHLSEDTLTQSRWNLNSTLVGTEIEYRAATQGQDVLKMDTKTFLFEGGYNRAFSPDIINVLRNAAGDLTFAMMPRVKTGGIWGNGAIPGLTDQNRYEIEIWDDNPNSSAATVVRELVLDGITSGSYTALQQTADFGSPQPGLFVRAYQVSNAGFRGYPNETYI